MLWYGLIKLPDLEALKALSAYSLQCSPLAVSLLRAHIHKHTHRQPPNHHHQAAPKTSMGPFSWLTITPQEEIHYMLPGHHKHTQSHTHTVQTKILIQQAQGGGKTKTHKYTCCLIILMQQWKRGIVGFTVRLLRSSICILLPRISAGSAGGASHPPVTSLCIPLSPLLPPASISVEMCVGESIWWEHWLLKQMLGCVCHLCQHGRSPDPMLLVDRTLPTEPRSLDSRCVRTHTHTYKDRCQSTAIILPDDSRLLSDRVQCG